MTGSAQAGIHTPRPHYFTPVADTFIHRESLWLMVWTAPYGISVPE